MKRFRSLVLAALAALTLGSGVCAQEAPQETVRKTTDAVISRVKDEKDVLRADPTRMYNLVSELVFPHFDFGVMSQFVLGAEWKTAEEAKRAEFVEQFRKLLVRTYAAALLEYSEQTIAYPDPGVTPRTRRPQWSSRTSPSPAVRTCPSFIVCTARRTVGRSTTCRWTE